MFSDAPGTVTPFLRAGSAVLGGGGATYRYFSSRFINEYDHVAIGATLTDAASTGNVTAVVVGPTSNTVMAVRTQSGRPGSQSPPLSTTELTDVNDSDDIAFKGGSTDFSPLYGLYIKRPGAMPIQVARQGSAAPQMAGGAGAANATVYAQDSTFGYGFAVDNLDRVLYEANVVSIGVPSRASLFAGSAAGPRMIAQVGIRPANVGGNATLSSINSFALSKAGSIVYSGTLTGTGGQYVICLGNAEARPEEFSIVARSGDAAPGTAGGVIISEVARPAVNDSGLLAFRCTLAGPGRASRRPTHTRSTSASPEPMNASPAWEISSLVHLMVPVYQQPSKCDS